MKDINMRRIVILMVVSFTCILLYKAMHHANVDSLIRNRFKGCDNLKGSESDAFILGRLLLAEKNWYEAVDLRHKYMKNKNLDTFKSWGDSGFTVLWNLFAPTFDCPYMRQRIGSIGDGGKWVCGFELLEETKTSQASCIVYSFGVNTESSFEAEILQKTNCDVFAYDMTVSKMGQQVAGVKSKLTFTKVGLGAKNTDDLKTLATLMEENGHTWIDILKIDIEGNEFEALEGLFNSYDILPFGQLQLEIHLQKFKFPKFYPWWEQLESKGLRPFSSEINLNPCVNTKRDPPELMEYSFINVRTNHMLVPKGFQPKM
ncbi:unnamed protein product [Orchesella dallaii]|uniref:Methyltransferase domain-containing protein n=1 Tax=Orchesella dallaii TaxID=48710 RepID=A0ABP1PVZ4_9HEXA